MKDNSFLLLLSPLNSRGFKIFLLTACLFSLNLPGFGQSEDDISVLLAVKLISPRRDDNPALKQVILSSITIEVERAGISVIPVTEIGAADITEDAYVAELAELYGNPGVLICYISGEEENLRIELVLNVKDRPDLRVRTIKEEKFGLSFDEAVSEAVSGILQQFTGDISILAKTSVTAEPRVIEPILEQSDGQPSPASTPDIMPEPEAQLEITMEPQEPELPQPASNVEDVHHGHFRASVGAAPFLAVGKVNYYFNTGILSSLQGGYTFITPIGSIEAGLSLGVLYFEASGLDNSSINFLFPLGVVARWGEGRAEDSGAFVTISGGPALFNMQILDTEQFYKITGFISGGGGFKIRLSDFLGITLEVDYKLFFEEYYPIMGIVPSIFFDICF